MFRGRDMAPVRSVKLHTDGRGRPRSASAICVKNGGPRRQKGWEGTVGGRLSCALPLASLAL